MGTVLFTESVGFDYLKTLIKQILQNLPKASEGQVSNWFLN